MKFTATPQRIDDPPPELDKTDGPTARFVEYRTQGLPRLYTKVAQLLPIGDQDADCQREKLLVDIDRYTRQAVAAELCAWRIEVSKLPDAGSQLLGNGPDIVCTGT